MDMIKSFFAAIRRMFFNLNKEQRKVISKWYEIMVFAAFAPILIKIIKNQSSHLEIHFSFWLLCTIIAAVTAVLALAEDE